MDTVESLLKQRREELEYYNSPERTTGILSYLEDNNPQTLDQLRSLIARSWIKDKAEIWLVYEKKLSDPKSQSGPHYIGVKVIIQYNNGRKREFPPGRLVFNIPRDITLNKAKIMIINT